MVRQKNEYNDSTLQTACDSVPTPKDECGWIALCDNKSIGWNSLLFLSDRTIKFALKYVEEEYRGRSIYRMLWNAF